jgi:hypothetical protein
VSKAAQALIQVIGQISLMNEFGQTLAATLVASIIVIGLLPSETGFDVTTSMYWDVWAATWYLPGF